MHYDSPGFYVSHIYFVREQFCNSFQTWLIKPHEVSFLYPKKQCSIVHNADQISTYHRASTKKWVWPNMTKLMNNHSPCSVSTVLKKKIFFLIHKSQPNWWEKASILKLLLTSTTTWPAKSVLLAKMLCLPILQSWAIWQEPIIRLLSPITCQTDPS